MLSDTEILRRIQDFNFKVENESRPFNPGIQINPASIDLRLSNTFWKPKYSGQPISFKSDAFGSGTVDQFERIALKEHDFITLKAGQFILCRTYESFSIPNDLSGRLHSKSSYSRMGIDVASTGDFINPGWQGHMPLIVRNLTKTEMQLRPFTSIVQLCLEQLSCEAEKPYPNQNDHSKYIDDEGGPSEMWQSLCREGLRETSFVGQPDDIEVIIGFGRKLNTTSLRDYLKSLSNLTDQETAKDVIKAYITHSRLKKFYYQIWTLVLGPMGGIALGFLLESVFKTDIGRLGYSITAIVISLLVFLAIYNLTSKFNSHEEMKSFWKEVGGDSLQ